MINEIAWREALYRQLAKQPGLPAGLRPELVKRAEGCIARGRPARDMAAYQGCKGAVGR